MKTTIIYAMMSIVILSACSKEKENLPLPTPPRAKDSTLLTNKDNASVFYSDWLSPESGAGSEGNNSGTHSGNTGSGSPGKLSTYQMFTVNAPAITQDILDKGVVMAYCRLENDNGFTRVLPTSVIISGFISNWDFVLSQGKIQFIQTTTNPAGIAPISGKNKFRYIIIPPTQHLRLSKPLSKMSYSEICSLLNISE